MSETLETIRNRRSIRAFREEQIKENDLETILEAGKYAPSAANQQSWHFTVVQRKEALQKINQVTKVLYEKSGNQKYADRAKAEHFSPFYNAPTYIIVSGEEKAIAPQADTALALGNMFLAAHDLGISSCWIHAVNFLYGTKEGKALFRELGVPGGYIPFGSGAFGYRAADLPTPAERRAGTVNYVR